jgi:hypothetical protein
MEILYRRFAQGNVRVLASHGVSSSLKVTVEGVTLPFEEVEDNLGGGREGLLPEVMEARKAILAWAKAHAEKNYMPHLRVQVSTSCGEWKTRIHVEEVQLEESGDVLFVDAFDWWYRGAYKAYPSGEGVELLRPADEEIERVGSTLGEFPSLRAYEDARTEAGLD